MKYILRNELTTLTLLFTVLLCVFGGQISAAIIEHTPLVKWLTANQVSNNYIGADFSLLPALAVVAISYLLSTFIYSVCCMISDLWDYFATPPASTIIAKAVSETESNTKSESSDGKTEPTLGNIDPALPLAEKKEKQE